MKKSVRRPAAKKPKKSSLAAGGLRLRLSPEELALHNSFGEEFSVKGLQDLRTAAKPKRRLSWTATARAMSKSKEAWGGLDRAALARVRKGIAEAGAGQARDLGSFARYSGTRITAPQRRRLVAAVNAQIAHYRRGRQLLRHVTADVLSAGLELFSSEDALVLWLCEPARALDGEIPLRAIRRAKGRARVVNILLALAHGVFL